ncbi:MAG: glycosyltransferase, partial [Candidatus Hodarchaeota archaeon]
VKENSAIEMENKILFLLENNKIALKMGAYGRKYIEEEYTIEKMSQKYLKLYASTLLASSKI